ncbi:MAG: carboxypeptidase regulatory-like domain-containing protein, partial [Acidobacteria bacterium]|nr:carboxypeptidase regulatory-like domain-containing protein [Acidobacteriota bacterium]
MRFSAFAAWLVVAAVAVPVAGQDDAVADASFQFVCPRESEPAFLDGIPVPTDDTWERRDDIPAGRAPAECWAWSDSCPPLFLEPGQNAAAACRAGSDSFKPLTVRVLDPETVNPIADPVDGVAPLAEYSVTAAPAAMWRQVPRDLLPTTTLASGSLSLPRNDEAWRLQALGEGLASTWRDLPSEEGSVELVLGKAVNLTVQVTAGGAPLAGARMYLVKMESGPLTLPEPLGFGMSDADGKVNLTVSARERAAVLVSQVTRTAAAFERYSEAPSVVELGPGFAVTGRTVDPEGRPIAGVRLLGLSWLEHELAVVRRHLGISGPDGRFSLTGFAKGAASLRTDGGDLEYSERFDLEESLDLGSIVLTAAETYWIQVLDASRGTPIPGARASSEAGEQTTTDREGIALVSPRFDRTLMISAKGYRRARFEIGGGTTAKERSIPGLPTLPVDVAGGAGATAEEPLVLRLDPAFTVEGVYMAADGVTPVASGRLVAARDMANGQTTSHRTIAADGSFSVDLEPGSYTLELSGTNAARTVLDVRGSAGDVRDLGVIAAPTSAWVSGTVVNPEYAPVFEASVSYTPPSEYGQLMAWAMGRAATVATNLDGYFELHGLELGSSTLRVEADGFAPLEFEVEANAIEWIDAGFVELSRGRRITVRSDVGRGQVLVDPGGRGLPRDLIMGDLEDGVAVVDRVPEGAFVVRVSENGVAACEKEVAEASGDDVVTCDRSTVTVTGRVTLAGQPGAGELFWAAKENVRHAGGFIRSGFGPLARTREVGPSRSQNL